MYVCLYVCIGNRRLEALCSRPMGLCEVTCETRFTDHARGQETKSQLEKKGN